jgi:folylpolyglutamate synthase/dihydropteroate synthase
LVDTDALNANIALLGLHLLQKHHPTAFPQLDLTSAATARALDTRPPCRWEEHIFTVPGTDCELDVILDMGHNPAALAALARRIAFKFPGRDVRYSIACNVLITACFCVH